VGVRADGPLRARVAALDDGRTRLVIAAFDALSVSAAVVARIRAALPGVHVMVAATHTHGSARWCDAAWSKLTRTIRGVAAAARVHPGREAPPL